MNKTTTKNQKLNAVVTNLLSADEEKVIGAIKDLRVDGTADVIPAVVEVLVNSPSDEVYNQLTNLLYELKDSKTIPYLFDAIKNENTAGHRHVLVGAFWQAGLNVEEYLPTLVQIAIEDDYMTCLECVTVIGEFEGAFKDDVVMDLTAKSLKAAEEQKEKQALLKELASTLKSLVVS